MSGATIGIKIADGTYYPILEEGTPSRKRLILTTARDEQSDVQIDLYKGDGPKIDEAVYIGSLVIEHLDPAPKGEPEIEMVVGLDQEGNLLASAGDSRTGERQSLNVSMSSLGSDGLYDVPDFELEDQYSPETEYMTASYSQNVESDEYSEEEPVAQKERKRNPFLMLAFILIAVAVVVLIAYLLYSVFRGPVVPSLEAQNDGNAAPIVAVAEEPSEVPGETVSSSQADAGTAGDSAAAPEASSGGPDAVAGDEASAAAAPSPPAETGTPAGRDAAAEGQMGTLRRTDEGVWYVIQWGDTLWDLSASFYRTPWKYGILARENKIKNPDLIYAGDDLFIPR